MEKYRDPREMLIVAPHAPLYFKLVARVTYKAKYLPDNVQADVESRSRRRSAMPRARSPNP